MGIHGILQTGFGRKKNEKTLTEMDGVVLKGTEGSFSGNKVYHESSMVFC